MGRGRTCWLLSPLLGFGLAVLPALPASAQNQGLVVRDGTLGSAPPGVVPTGLDDLGEHADYLICADLGAQRGGNLFHSFGRFSIGSGERATFTDQGAPNPGAIDNVISRVTGGSESRIDGTLRSTISGADIWLLNPSGVVFGAGAKLDVPGSFHAGTGDYVDFGEGDLVRFYADPTRPSVLSTARPEAFGFLGESGAAPLVVDRTGLAVPDGAALSLVGGDVSLTGAELSAPGGHVSLEAQGEIALSDSRVAVGGETPGAVSIRGGRLVMTEGSNVLADNESTVPDPPGEPGPGSISIEASESVLVDDSLLSVSTHAAGNAGTIHLESPSVTFQNGPGLPLHPESPRFETEVGARAETTSSGKGGLIDIDAGSLTLRNGVAVSATALAADVFGDPGTIEISGGSMELSAGSWLGGGAWGSLGNAGTVTIDLTGTLRLDAGGPSAGALPPYAFISTFAEGARAHGQIDVTAGAVELVNGGRIGGCYECSSNRLKDAANVRIAADRIVVEGVPEGAHPAEASAVVVNTGDEGDAGTIAIATSSLELRTGGFVSTSSALGVGATSAGDAGDIEVVTDSLVIEGSPGVFTGIFARSEGGGRAGTIALDADSVRIREGFIDVGAFAFGRGRTGTAGTIDIATRTLAIEAGGLIDANSATLPLGDVARGGDAGTILVTALESISSTNEGGGRFSLAKSLLGQPTASPTGIFAATVFGGQGGAITLDAPEITVARGAGLSTGTVGGLSGGTLELSGRNIRIVDGGSMNSASLMLGGDAGDVTLTATESIQVAGSNPAFPDDLSIIHSATIGSGAAGTVTLRAPRIVVEDGGRVTTTALPARRFEGGGARGNIALEADQVIVRSGGRIDASSFVDEPAGDVEVVARESILVEGEESGIGSRTGRFGPGGSVALRAPRIEIAEGGEVTAESSPGYQGLSSPLLEAEGFIAPDHNPDGSLKPATGDAGSVTLAADRLLLTGGTIATNAETADGGDIEVQAKRLVHLDAGEITAAVNDGAGGNITIDPEVVILQNGSRIVANAGAGAGGNIQITADNYFAFPGTVVDASSELGIDGIVEVHAPDVDLAGKITALPTTFLDAASLMRERCAARRSGERAGSFAVRGNGGIPPEPDGWLPASVAPDLARGPASVKEGATGSLTAAGDPLVARLLAMEAESCGRVASITERR